MGVAGTIAKNTLFSFIGTGSDAIITFVAGIVLARGLGTEQYGLYSLMMWFLSLAALVINLGLAEMPKRYIAESIGQGNRIEAHGFVRLTMMIRGMSVLVGCIVIIITSRYWASLFGNPSNQVYFVLVAIALLPHGFYYALQSIFAGFQRYDYGAYVFLGSNPLRMILIIVLMVLGFGVREVMILYIAMLCLGVFIGLSLLRRLMPFKELLSPLLLKADVRNRALKYALAMAGVISVNYLLYQQIEVFFIGLYCPVAEVGFYNLAARLAAMSMTLIPSAFAIVLLPAIAEQFGKGDMEKIRTIYLASIRCLMVVSLFLTAAQIALARPLIILLYGADYVPSVILMQILILPFALASIAQAGSAVISGINQPGYILKTGLVLVVLSIGLDIWIIPKHGVMGAAIASSIPRFLCLPLYAFFVSRKTGVTWPVVDTLKIVLISAITGGVLFILQSHLGTILSLVVGIPVGIVLYVVGISASRVIRSPDLVILKRAENSMPRVLRKSYAIMLGVVERVMLGTKIANK
jgi:O-antigen/teichoic acid export membrane protein